MATITSASTVQRRDTLLANELGPDEMVMLDVERGTYFGLREVGKHIWDELAGPVQVEQLCASLVQQYDVEPARCEADVLAFLSSLADQALIEVLSGDDAT